MPKKLKNMKKFDLETKEGRHEFYKYVLCEYKKQEHYIKTLSVSILPLLCPFFEGVLLKSNYKEVIPKYDEYVTICRMLPEFFAKKPPGVLPREIWWRTNEDLNSVYQKRVEILKELVEETKNE